MPTRRFPPPWTVEDINAAFVVTDGEQKLGCFQHPTARGFGRRYGAIASASDYVEAGAI